VTEVFQIADRHQNVAIGVVGRGDVLAAQEAVSRYPGTLNAYSTNRDKANATAKPSTAAKTRGNPSECVGESDGIVPPQERTLKLPMMSCID
jgi:hypothetical protein